MNGGVFDEDVDVRSHLAALGPAALAELRRVLEAPDRTPGSFGRLRRALPTQTSQR